MSVRRAESCVVRSDTPTRGAQPFAFTQTALVALGAVNQTCGFFTRGTVIRGESISLRASTVINRMAVLFTMPVA